MINPSLSLLSLAEHDERFCFIFNINSNLFEYVNTAFKAFFKADIGNLTLAKLLKIVHPQDLGYLKESLKLMQPGDFKSNVEFRVLQLPDKKESSLRLSLFYDDQLTEQNKTNTLTGYIEDITSYKEQNDKLKEYSNKKNSVLNILSHDLAGPLGSIQNLAGLLSRKSTLLQDPEVVRWLSLIEKISKKGITLIQEFVKQEFIEFTGTALLKQRTDLVQEIKIITEQYQQPENGLNIEFCFNTSQEQIFVDIDEPKFLQVISNLVSNAIKFTPDGGTITLGLTEKESIVLITVADNGIGIPQKFHAGLFNKFTDARRTGLKGETSVGLGMSIIKTIVDWHEGKIWFESVENKGTTFYIEIAGSK